MITTKEKIIISFIDLSTKLGFKKVRISQICINVKIERKLFYYYFEDKYDLLKYIYNRDIETNFSLDSTSKKNWQENSLNLLKYYKNNNKFYYSTIFEDNDLFINIFSNHMEKLFLKLFNELSIKETNNSNIKFYARFFSSGWVGAVIEWGKDRFSQDENYLIHNFNNLINFTKESLYNW